MKSFYKTFPHLLAAKSLDAILDEQEYDDYVRSKIFSAIHTSYVMFKEAAKIKYFSNTILDLCYKNRCETIDAMNLPVRAKTHIKNMIYAGCRRQMTGSATYKGNKMNDVTDN